MVSTTQARPARTLARQNSRRSTPRLILRRSPHWRVARAGVTALMMDSSVFLPRVEVRRRDQGDTVEAISGSYVFSGVGKRANQEPDARSRRSAIRDVCGSSSHAADIGSFREDGIAFARR